MRFAATALVAALLALATPASASTERTFGAGVGKATAVKVSELMANPDKYVGKAVRVEGLVTDVCPSRGCWMELASDKEFQTIKVKVQDGVIVFPLDLKGRSAAVEGVFTKITIPAEKVLEMRRHEAQEKGQPFDPKSVKKEAQVVYQIQGTGAVVR